MKQFHQMNSKVSAYKLGEHRCAGLLENLEAGELAALGGDIHIDNPTIGGFKVDGIDVQKVLSEVNAAHFRTVLGPHVGYLLERLLRQKGVIFRIADI